MIHTPTHAHHVTFLLEQVNVATYVYHIHSHLGRPVEIAVPRTARGSDRKCPSLALPLAMLWSVGSPTVNSRDFICNVTSCAVEFWREFGEDGWVQKRR